MLIFLSFLCGIASFYTFRLFPVSTLILYTAASGYLLYRRKYILVPLIIVGFLYAFFRFVPPMDALDRYALSDAPVRINCIIENSPQASKSGRFINEATALTAYDTDTGSELNLLSNREISVISEEGLQKGFRYELLAKIAKDFERRNPGMIRRDRLYVYLTDIVAAQENSSRGYFSLTTWFQEKRDALNQHLSRTFKGDTGALIAAMTTGDRTIMSDSVKDAFASTGLAHLLSISGTHFGLFSALLFWLFRFVILSLPYKYLQRFTIYLTPPQAAAIISIPFMLSYLVISGASIPAVRSFIMISLVLLGLLIDRKGFWLNSTLFAAFVICLWEPSALLDLSFQLSFLAVLFLGVSLKSIESLKEQRFMPRILSLLKETFRMSLIISLGTAPLVAYYFHYFSIVSPVSNLLITPFIGFILVPPALLSTFVFIFTGWYPFEAVIATIADLSLESVRLFAAIPFTDIKVPPFPLIVAVFFYAGLLVYLLLLNKEGKTKRYALILPIAALVFFSAQLIPGKDSMSITWLDVGQGDSAVIEASGKTIVIDTGRTGKEVEGHLKYLGKSGMDVLVVTHADGDHSGGVPYLAERVKIKELWDNGLIIYPAGVLKNITKRSLERGDLISAKGLKIQALHPYKGFYTFEDNESFAENNSSLVLKITGAKKSFLFTADTAEEAEDDMLHLGELLKSDVLKVSHHGSRTSSTEDFLKAVSPEIAVLSVGRFNTYGHPNADTMGRLEGVKVYRTDRDGAVKITEDSGVLRVKTFRDLDFERAKNTSAEWRNIKRLFMQW